MSRITIDEVRAAYAATGVKPKRGDYVDRQEDGTLCACAIGALAIQAGVESHYAPVRRWAHEKYGLGYVNAFVAGFDGDLIDGNGGCRDGIDVAEAIFGKASCTQ